MVCGACNLKLGPDDPTTISCSACPTKYHVKCLNLAREELRAIRNSGNTCMKCPSCEANKRGPRLESTPVRGLSKVPDGNTAAAKQTGGEGDGATNPAHAQLINTFSHSLQQLQEAFDKMKQEMCAFTYFLNSTSEDISNFRKELSEMKNELQEVDRCKLEVSGLRAEVAELRQEMEFQQQRQFNKDIEINGLVEQKGENLMQIMSVASTVLGIELCPNDIDDIRRVGARNGETGGEGRPRPRPVILTLARRATRDQLIRAARVRRGLTTDMFGMPGNPIKVYFNEHLTKPNRILYSKTRAVGKELGFKFVWTKDGNIYMRRSETSSVLRVTSEATLKKLAIEHEINNSPRSPPRTNS